MNDKKYEVTGIGNAIVDIISYKTEEFLEKNDMPKGAMTLIDSKTAKKLYKQMGAATECSGGSAANTLAGFSMLGGNGSFIAKVNDDSFGHIFQRSLQKTGVEFLTPPVEEGNPTGHCLIFVTEKESKISGEKKVERTMATHLGISVELNEDDIDEEVIKASKIIYTEGYLWYSETARKAIMKAIDIAKANDVQVSFSLSDRLCVDAFRDDFIDLLENYVDILFCNEHEIEALYQESDIRKILYRVGSCNNTCLDVAAVTRSEKGSYILTEGNVYTIDPEPVKNVFDVTGAGDLYASGFLYGYVHGFTPEKSGKLASRCASEVIRYIGARPITKLSELLEDL